MIEEGDEVVTPEGKVGKTKFEGNPTPEVTYYTVGNDRDKWIKRDLVCVDEPLRISVDCERHAKWLVEEAEGLGWNKQCDFSRYDRELYLFKPYYMRISDQDYTDPDPHWPSDYDQVVAYLEYHAEAEDCETCGGDQEIPTTFSDPPNSGIKKPCPDCTEDEQKWDEPCPEDREWREMVRDFVSGPEHEKTDQRLKGLGLYSGTGIVNCLLDYIDELEGTIDVAKSRLIEMSFPEDAEVFNILLMEDDQ